MTGMEELMSKPGIRRQIGNLQGVAEHGMSVTVVRATFHSTAHTAT